MELKITPSGQTIVKPTALGPGANTDTKLLIYGLFQKGRVLAQDGVKGLDDNRKIKLEQWIRAGIEPRVYVQLCQIDGYPDGPVLVVRVQKSWVGPHMVKDEPVLIMRF